ncbi:right-handed parallel beta-helix repeat-containing protein [Halobacterium salinarum]|uniref:Pectin lyase domain protein n=5 Tax=Halobacterium salinarum TaxID=2242 RepID=Q9HQ54_HALSA|nr:right-handed parallel beta-helix repeat-containing protein [Halobacterium salinarum]AAG19663.1 conserved hypothetical protein [Halobacterium salinarum NRC-1]MBB6088665.1 hypothetical protein [Halobacterium salinarum]MDL0118927.1 right-handed parallel beta-helix repeat-containing protein [Halobacterium salinarum]MDL0130971.1 right-handed parallel beta-helix repeat-containing protein [Halobacterium salinarum]MDL0145395.1 right-handed parallel beta-helix repeat-containing protein [Halobacteriu
MRRAVVCLLAALAVGLVFAAAALGAGTSAAATGDATYVGTNVTTNTTWTPGEGPYVVTTELTVTENATLTVAPGTTVQVAKDASITVAGSLDAAGTSTDRVSFTTARPKPQPGSWTAITYAGTADSRLRLANTTVEYATTAVRVASADGRITVQDSLLRKHVRAGVAVTTADGPPSLRLARSTIADTGYAGVAVTTPGTDPFARRVAGVTIRDTDFRNPGQYGVVVRARHLVGVSVVGGSITGYESGGVAVSTGNRAADVPGPDDRSVTYTTVHGVEFADARGDAVTIESGHLDRVRVSDIDVHGVDGDGIGVRRAIDLDDVVLDDNTVRGAARGIALTHRRAQRQPPHVSVAVTNNTLRETVGAGVSIDAQRLFVSRLDVRNNTVTGSGGDGVALHAPVLSGATIADNTVRGSHDRGVNVRGSRVRNLTVAGNRVAANGRGGVRVRAARTPGPLTVANNTLVNNVAFGARVSGAANGGPVAARNNTVAANTRGITVDGPSPVRLTGNTIAVNTRSTARSADASAVGPSVGVTLTNASGNVTITRNDIYGHLVGLRAATNGTIDAEHNYWGAPSGPFYASVTPDGDGDTIRMRRGVADIAPIAETPHRALIERPSVSLTANRSTVAAGTDVRVTAASPAGPNATYQFTVDGQRRPTQASPSLVSAFDDPGAHEIAVAVVNDRGVASRPPATTTVRVEDASTAPATTAPPPTAGPPQPADSAAPPSLLDSVLSVPGLLGGALWVLAVGVGGYGVVASMRGAQPPVRGRVAHALAVVAAGVWIAAGLLAVPPLLSAGGVALAGWGVVTAAVVAAASR